LRQGELGPHLAQCGLGQDLLPCQVASCSIQPSGHNRHGPKLGSSAPFGEGAGSPYSTMSLGLRPTSLPSDILIHPGSGFQQIWAETTDMGRKLGGSAPFYGWGAGSLSNTMSLVLRPTSLPSGMLIHPAIRPQQILAENWGMCPFGEGELGPYLAQCGLGGDLYLHA